MPRHRITAGRPFSSTHWGVPDPGPRYRRRGEKRILTLPPRQSRCWRVCAYGAGRQAPESAGQLGRGPAYPVCTHWALARECCAPLRTPGFRAADGAADGRGPAPAPPSRCALTAQRRTVVVARIERANRAACGAAEALRLPKVEEPVQEAVSAPGEPRIAAQVRIRDHPAAGDLAGRRLHRPEGGFIAFARLPRRYDPRSRADSGHLPRDCSHRGIRPAAVPAPTAALRLVGGFQAETPPGAQ